MNNQNVVKILLPLVAVVVIFEAVVLVNSLTKNGEVKINNNTLEISKSDPSPTEKVEDSVMNIDIQGSEAMTKGKLSPVEVVLTSEGDYKLDAINLFVKYDPKVFDISGLKFDPKLPNPTFSKASTAKGLVVVNFMITAKDGLAVSKDEKISLVTFNALPKESGNFEFEINSGKEAKESATMIVETESSKVLPFSASKLTVFVN